MSYGDSWKNKNNSTLFFSTLFFSKIQNVKKKCWQKKVLFFSILFVLIFFPNFVFNKFFSIFVFNKILKGRMHACTHVRTDARKKGNISAASHLSIKIIRSNWWLISVNYWSIICLMNRKCMFTWHNMSIQSWCGVFENDVNNFLLSLISAN